MRSPLTLKSGDMLASAARDRRRRATLALPRRRRHRLRTSATTSRSRSRSALHTFAPASRHLDRIPYGQRAVHAGATARQSIEPGVGARSRAKPNVSPRSTMPNSRRRSKRASHSILGKIAVEAGPRHVSARRCHARKRFAAKRIALVGEAAHVIPPIGAQGLNLGLRDAATIGELAVAAHRDGQRYRRRRCAHGLRQDAPRRCRQPHARRRSAQSHAAHAIFFRCKARAGSGFTCSTGSGRCAARSCARAWRLPPPNRG